MKWGRYSLEAEAKEAIRLLYDKYADDIYRYARLLLGDSSEAHDVVQEVFFRAFQSWGGFRRDASERTWLMTITRNHVFDLIRKRHNDMRLLLNCTPPHLIGEDTNVELVIDLENLISTLKDDYRQVFILRHVYEFSISQVAGILGWSKGKVRITDFRALAKLRRGFSDREEVHGGNGFHTENKESLK